MGYDGSDKGGIYQERDECGKAIDDPAVRGDFSIPTLVGVFC
jgi:hypothetical protein